MSDSDLSDAPTSKVPSDGALEKALRKETAVQFEDTSKSINSIRKGAEESLGLRIGFFVHDERWKARSKEIIRAALDVLEKAAESSSSPVSAKPSPTKPKIVQPATKAARKKRPPPPTEKPSQKRQKKSLPREDNGDELSSLPANDSGTDAKANAKKAKAKPTTKSTPLATTLKQSHANGKTKPKPKSQDSDSELSDDPADDPADDSDSAHAPGKVDDDSGSEMSVLIDEDPQPKKKKRKSKDPSEKPKKTAKAKPTAEDDPDQEEIKRLQGWLVKCGIRKIWAFELKPYDTSKAKIKHLKDMLADVGMTGRYSLEKASQVKEARELAADIEAVQEGNEIWGKDGEERSRRSKRSDRAATEDDVDDEDIAPKKKLVRGPKRYDFLSSDGEESD